MEKERLSRRPGKIYLDAATLAANIGYLSAWMGIGKEELARRSALSSSTIQSLSKGKRKTSTLKVILRIASALNVSPNKLLHSRIYKIISPDEKNFCRKWQKINSLSKEDQRIFMRILNRFAADK